MCICMEISHQKKQYFYIDGSTSLRVYLGPGAKAVYVNAAYV